MSNTILLRRGTKSQFQSYSPVAGELTYTTDEKQVYVGSYSVSQLWAGDSALTIYASPNGVSTNSGMSANDPLPIVDAFELAKTLPTTETAPGGIKIQLATGSYYITASLTNDSGGPVRVIGNSSNPRNCKVYMSGSSTGFQAFVTSDMSFTSVSGVQLIPQTSVSGSTNQYTGFLTKSKSMCDMTQIVFGENGKWFRYLSLTIDQSTAYATSTTMSIDSGVMVHAFSSQRGSMSAFSNVRVEFSNTPAIPWFIYVAMNSNMIVYTPFTASGTHAVSRKGSISQFSTVNLNGLTTTAIPGSIAFESGSNQTSATT